MSAALLLVATPSVPGPRISPNTLSLNAAVAPPITLNDGNTMPDMALGVFRVPPGNATFDSVLSGLKVGFRSIDTAQLYQNEASVGAAVRASGIPRDEIFVTTKMSRGYIGLPTNYSTTLATLQTSLSLLKMDYVDLYLLHSPRDTEKNIKEQWEALIYAKKQGLAKNIGVSDFLAPQLQWLADASEKPVVNQIELSPFLYKYRKTVLDYCKEKDIAIEPWGALVTDKVLNDTTLVNIAKSVSKTVPDVLLKWSLQKGYLPLVTSTNTTHQKEDLAVATEDWMLSAQDMATLDAIGNSSYFGESPADIAGVGNISAFFPTANCPARC